MSEAGPIAEEVRTTRMAPRSWGLDFTALAAHETIFRPGLLEGKRLLISGAGSGMGRATAMLAARLGAELAICGRRAEALDETAAHAEKMTGRAVLVHPMTIREPEQVGALFDAVHARFGGLDGLVNSAGGQFPQASIDFSVKGWNAVVDTNLNGTWYMMQAAAKRWHDTASPGSIVNVVAMIDRGIPQSAHTCAARAGVVYLSKSVAVEWAPLSIRVNCVAPGTIETQGLNNYPPEMLTRLGRGNPMRRMGDVWDIAESIIYLLADSGKFITGEMLHVDGGMQMWGTNWPLGTPEHFKVDQ